ncbi:hypothetical protein [Flexivirga caeni]|uniref:Uncharacterized protein n=1 Tax=Flexivirga caeni TaxID=2294115 RepID=A0A3M9MII5_9MICO|nr:hypothetical protein [Flexivirga caeni]RNI25372.1 hypothetical protein EFY87_01715 [Flexivirga caeni]
MTGHSGVRREALDGDTVLAVGESMTSGSYGSIFAATRTRAWLTLVTAGHDEFRVLRQSRTGWTLTTGHTQRLPGELVGLPAELETLTVTRPEVDPPPAHPRPSTALGPGEVLALAELVRTGDSERIHMACEDLGLAGIPWWITQFAWGAEALLSMTMTIDDNPQFASVVHLLPSGWGCLHAGTDDDLAFRPMSTVEVQGRLGAFAARLVECAA